MATKQFLVDINLNNVAKVINSLEPTAAGDLATKGYVDNLLNGMSWKAAVRVSPASNINIAIPTASIDGVAMSASDRVLLRAQSNGAENGIYIYNGPSSAMTRSDDANTSAEVQGMAVRVNEGPSAQDTTWIMVTDNITLGTTALSFTQLGSAAPSATETTSGIAEIATQVEADAGVDDQRFITPLKLANWSKRALSSGLTIGDGSATSYAITHSWNNRDYNITVYRNSGTFEEVEVEKQHGLNSATIVFNSAPALNSFRLYITRNQ
jgi:hypothetical protein